MNSYETNQTWFNNNERWTITWIHHFFINISQYVNTRNFSSQSSRYICGLPKALQSWIIFSPIPSCNGKPNKTSKSQQRENQVISIVTFSPKCYFSSFFFDSSNVTSSRILPKFIIIINDWNGFLPDMSLVLT